MAYRQPIPDFRPHRDEVMTKVEGMSEINLVTGCWEWTAGRNALGYGQLYFKGFRSAATRIIYCAIHGPFDSALDVCHSCDNPLCVNPEHIRVDTHRNNLRDASKRKRLNGQWKTHCKRGHPLSGDNLYIDPSSGFRQCKACCRERQRREYHNPLKNRRAAQQAYRQRKRAERQGATR